MTEKQLKTRWREIKKVLRQRPLLIYKAGVPLDMWNDYIYSVPEESEVLRIHEVLLNDRKEKTQRLKEELSEMVGYRETKKYSKLSGVSDTAIRQIIEGKKEGAGYDIINRLELFVHSVNPQFDLSVENNLTPESFSVEHSLRFAKRLNSVGDNLKTESYQLMQRIKDRKVDADFFGREEGPTQNIQMNIERLEVLKSEIDDFWNVYIKGASNNNNQK